MATPGASSDSLVTDAEAANFEPRRGLPGQQAAIAGIAPLTPRVMSFVFAPSEPFAFRAGQHVDVRLTAPDGYRAQRSYSISSAPEAAGTFDITIERLDDGEVSPFFHEIVQVGDEIEVRGPLGGHFVWSVNDGGPLLLIGGGSGVCPLMAMVRHRVAQKSDIPVALIFSARTWDELLFRDELLSLFEARVGFELVVAVTREAPPREDFFGRRIDKDIVAEALRRLGMPPKHVFICGGNPFVENAATAAMANGIEAHTIRTERYGL
jgi:ferredoxin-NADP reductase